MSVDFALWKHIIEVKLKRLEGYHHVSVQQGLYAQVILLEQKIEQCEEMLDNPHEAYEQYLGRIEEAA